MELELLRARDELQAEVIERTQQASLLDLTHDAIFVRDMSAIITYWNRGAEELYGWTPEPAIWSRSHDLLQTGFPVALEDINAELLRPWEGEPKHTKFRRGPEYTGGNVSPRRRQEMRLNLMGT